ncbi:MAG: (2Fe-2S)-binding protein, partial [Sphingomonadaceae bacterium]
GQLKAALYISRTASLPAREWLIEQLQSAEADSAMALLAGRPATPRPDRGPIVCVCFDVGMKQIMAAITGQALTSVEAVGAALSAGTNCGSCRPAIQRLIGEMKEVANG